MRLWRRRKKKLEFAGSTEIDKRKRYALEFYEVIDFHPLFVSDEATIFETTMDDADEASRRIEEHYGVRFARDELDLPLWQVLDLLQVRRSR